MGQSYRYLEGAVLKSGGELFAQWVVIACLGRGGGDVTSRAWEKGGLASVCVCVCVCVCV